MELTVLLWSLLLCCFETIAKSQQDATCFIMHQYFQNCFSLQHWPRFLQCCILFGISSTLHKGLLAWSKSVLFTNNVLLGLASWRARKVKRQPTCDGVKSEFSTMTWEALGRKGKNKNTRDWCCSCLWESNQDTATRNPCTAIMSPPTLDIYTISWC